MAEPCIQLSDEVAVLAVLGVLSREEAYYREARVLDHRFWEPVSWLWAPGLGSFVGRAVVGMGLWGPLHPGRSGLVWPLTPAFPLAASPP